jgi:hypothetical protein
MDNTRPDEITTQRPPLTFLERNAFLLAGMAVFTVLSALLGLVLYGFYASEIQREESNQEFQEAAKVREKTSPKLNPLPLPPADKLNKIPLPLPPAQKAAPEQTSAQEADELIPEEPSIAIAQRERAAGDATMAGFWGATSIEEKSAFVHDRTRVKPLLKRYYEDENHADIPHGPLRDVGFYRMGTAMIQHRTYDQPGRDDVLELALRRQEDGTYVLDWESYIGASDLSWAEFRRIKPTLPVLFRAYAVLSDYYNYGYEDSSRYLCVKLLSRTSERPLYGYCDRNSAAARALAGIVNSTNTLPLTVKLSYRPATPSVDCVNLEAVISKRWLLP